MENTLAELDAMVAAVSAGPDIYKPSPFWADLASVHRRQLEEDGFENFKRTVNFRYFNWNVLGILRHQLFSVGRRWLSRPSWAVLASELTGPPNHRVGSLAELHGPTAWVYRVFVAMYADVVKRQDHARLLETLEEPPLGNPLIVRHHGRSISQDLCNSVHELYSILEPGAPAADGKPLSVAELGAGYGRLAYVFLRALPNASYTIVDIPPALCLSQWYLSSLFPDHAVFRFRPFERFEEVREEFEAARIRFLAPHQLEALPPKYFDYFINISSLHEMTVAQVARYFEHMGRLCRGRAYIKQWRVSRARVNGCVIREADYPVPPAWKVIFHRRHPIQRMFFEALYEIGESR